MMTLESLEVKKGEKFQNRDICALNKGESPGKDYLTWLPGSPVR